MRRLRLVVATAVALAVLAGGCVDDARVASVPTDGESAPSEVRPDLLPAHVADLAVVAEDISKLEEDAGPDSYLGDARLWSLRTGPRLRATLQVGRFVPDASPEEREFQERIVTQIGQSAARRRTLGGVPVYVTSSNQQSLFLWFRHRHLFVLSVAADYPEPRTLLRSMLEVAP